MEWAAQRHKRRREAPRRLPGLRRRRGLPAPPARRASLRMPERQECRWPATRPGLREELSRRFRPARPLPAGLQLLGVLPRDMVGAGAAGGGGPSELLLCFTVCVLGTSGSDRGWCSTLLGCKGGDQRQPRSNPRWRAADAGARASCQLLPALCHGTCGGVISKLRGGGAAPATMPPLPLAPPAACCTACLCPISRATWPAFHSQSFEPD